MKHSHVTRGANYEKKAADFLDKYSTQIAVETFIPLEPTEPDDLIVDLDCKILLSGSRGGEDDIEAGHIKAYLVQLALAIEHYSQSPRDIMDSHSQEVAEYIELLDDDGNLRGISAISSTFLEATYLFCIRRRSSPSIVDRASDSWPCGE
jgi:hypothetical protein